MDHLGIDVHKKDSQICTLAEGGELIEQRIRTEPERFAAVLGGRPRARIVLEASTDSEWVARCLEGLSHGVIVADPNFAPMYATRTRKVKTDRGTPARWRTPACSAPIAVVAPARRLAGILYALMRSSATAPPSILDPADPERRQPLASLNHGVSWCVHRSLAGSAGG